ncbi:MAG: MarR family transcriptional regulator [Armatimonadetes bacterium]|nr:MarR family transcriptional regulator [Armatimonadota bacterium]
MQQGISDGDYEALADFRYALRRFLRFSEQAARRAGLAPTQHQALLAARGFAGHKCITVGELAERLQIKPNSAVELVDRMEKQGFVRRQTSTEDKRRVQIVVTNEGEKLLESLSEAHKTELAQLAPELRRTLAMLQHGQG